MLKAFAVFIIISCVWVISAFKLIVYKYNGRITCSEYVIVLIKALHVYILVNNIPYVLPKNKSKVGK